VSADVQLGVHGIRDIIMQYWDTYCRDVLRDVLYFYGLEQGWIRWHFLLHQRWHRWRDHGVVYVCLQRRIRRHKLPDRQCVHCLLSLEQGWIRWKLLLHQRRHRRRDHRLVHVHMQSGIRRHGLSHCQRVHRFVRLEQGWKRRHLLLHQRRHCRRDHRLVHVHIMRRGVRRCELPDFQYMFGKRVRVLECVHDLPGRHDKRLRG
jgi:hypothetical protein